MLTRTAIEQGYTEPRKAPAGNTINTWIKKRECPAWSVKAATKLLLDFKDYLPNTDDESRALGLALAEVFPHSKVPADFDQILPEHLKGILTESLLEDAIRNRKLAVGKKEGL